jgi:myo-inositol-1(or 4)-monophosphatase
MRDLFSENAASVSLLRHIAENIAGPLMRKYHGEPGQVKSTLKPDLTPVTEADIMIDERAVRLILENYPECGIIREEGKNINEKADEIWYVDGIDGTGEFRRGGRDAVFAGAYESCSEVRHSVIYNPLVDPTLLFAAMQGQGAFLNGRKLQVSSTKDTSKHPLVEVASAPGGLGQPAMEKMFLVAQDLQDRGFNVNVVRSISYSNALVATGLSVGTIFPWRTLWDIAPGDLMVREAGGRTSDLRGNPIKYRGAPPEGTIMSNGHFHDLLVGVVAKYL